MFQDIASQISSATWQGVTHGLGTFVTFHSVASLPHEPASPSVTRLQRRDFLLLKRQCTSGYWFIRSYNGVKPGEWGCVQFINTEQLRHVKARPSDTLVTSNPWNLEHFRATPDLISDPLHDERPVRLHHTDGTGFINRSYKQLRDVYPCNHIVFVHPNAFHNLELGVVRFRDGLDQTPWIFTGTWSLKGLPPVSFFLLFDSSPQ